LTNIIIHPLQCVSAAQYLACLIPAAFIQPLPVVNPPHASVPESPASTIFALDENAPVQSGKVVCKCKYYKCSQKKWADNGEIKKGNWVWDGTRRKHARKDEQVEEESAAVSRVGVRASMKKAQEASILRHELLNSMTDHSAPGGSFLHYQITCQL
jgi:hypothetical protein